MITATRILGAILAGLLVLQGSFAALPMGDELRAGVTVGVSVAVAVVGYLLREPAPTS